MSRTFKLKDKLNGYKIETQWKDSRRRYQTTVQYRSGRKKYVFSETEDEARDVHADCLLEAWD